MPLDGVVLHHILKELTPLIGSQIQRIRQSSHDEFLFSCYQPGQAATLLLSPHPEEGRIHLTTKAVDDSGSSHFLTIARHHIEQGFIKAIQQHGNDRVLTITIQKTNPVGQIETLELIAELMNRHSNLFIVKDSLIIDSWKRVPPFSEATRTVLPNTPYTYPVDAKPNPFDGFHATTFDAAMAYQGVSPLLANAVEHRGVRLSDPIVPRLGRVTNQYHVYDCFDEAQTFATISELLDTLYFDVKQEQRHAQQINDLTASISSKIAKAVTKLSHLEDDLEHGEERETWKRYGDVLYANLASLRKGARSVTLTDFDGVTQLTIPLQETKSPQENAANYFKKYQKAKKAMEHIASQKQTTVLDIELLQQTLYDIQQASPNELAALRLSMQPTKQRKQKQVAQQPKQYRLGDVVFYVGQNAKQNEVVTFELAKPNDLWLHVKDAPGAHVIAKTTNVTEAVLRFAANLAACHSAAKHSSSVEVQYTERKHIKKIPGYPGSMVQVGTYRTIFIDPDCSTILTSAQSHTKNE